MYDCHGPPGRKVAHRDSKHNLNSSFTFSTFDLVGAGLGRAAIGALTVQQP